MKTMKSEQVIARAQKRLGRLKDNLMIDKRTCASTVDMLRVSKVSAK